jgi:hypothetical protein
MNDEDNKYHNMKTEDTITDAMYIMKANQVLNSEMYAYCQSEINSGRVNFLVDESIAKNKLLSQAQGKKMSQSQRADYLMPFVQTSILKDQIMVINHIGIHIVVVEDITEDVDVAVAVAEDLVAVDILDNNTNNLKINQI